MYTSKLSLLSIFFYIIFIIRSNIFKNLMEGQVIMEEIRLKKKRGPAKKPGFRQELRVTPTVEQVFNLLREKHDLKNNSEALNKIAQMYLSDLDTINLPG